MWAGGWVPEVREVFSQEVAPQLSVKDGMQPVAGSRARGSWRQEPGPGPGQAGGEEMKGGRLGEGGGRGWGGRMVMAGKPAAACSPRLIGNSTDAPRPAACTLAAQPCTGETHVARTVLA